MGKEPVMIDTHVYPNEAPKEVFQCDNCNNPSIDCEDSYCSNCGAEIDWYDSRFTTVYCR